jgi:hypothetical protein
MSPFGSSARASEPRIRAHRCQPCSSVAAERPIELAFGRNTCHPVQGAAARASVLSADQDPPRVLLNDRLNLAGKRQDQPASGSKRTVDLSARRNLPDRPGATVGAREGRTAALSRSDRIHPESVAKRPSSGRMNRPRGDADLRCPLMPEPVRGRATARDGMENDVTPTRILRDRDKSRRIRKRSGGENRILAEPRREADATAAVAQGISEIGLEAEATRRKGLRPPWRPTSIRRGRARERRPRSAGGTRTHGRRVDLVFGKALTSRRASVPALGVPAKAGR